MDSPRIRPGNGSGTASLSRFRTIAFLLGLTLIAVFGSATSFAESPAAAVSREKPAPVSRIVSLAPNLTEILIRLGAGDRLVGRSSACREPAAQIRDIPIAGDFGTPNLEMLARLHPDVVVTTALSDPGQQARMELLGTRVLVIPTRRMDDIPRAIRCLGALADQNAEAETAARAMEERIKTARRAASPHPPKVYLEIWGDPLTTAGADSFLTDMVALAGGHSIFADTRGDYFTVSPEAVAARDPDVIVFLERMEPAEALRAVQARPGWSHLRAVREERVRTLRDPDRIQQPGWNAMEGVEALRACLKDPEARAP